MTIVGKIKQSITDATGLPVYYHDEPTLNLLTSSMDFPCCLFQLLSQGAVVNEGGQIKERVTAALFFVDRSDFDFDAESNEEIIDACKGRAFAWLASLNVGGLLTLTANNGTRRIYDRYDDILTGFGLSVDLTEQVGLCIPAEYGCSDFNSDFNLDFGGECDIPTDGDFNDDFNNDFKN